MALLEILTGTFPVDADATVQIAESNEILKKNAIIEEKDASASFSLQILLPPWKDGAEDAAAALAEGCRTCLRHAEDCGVRRIAFTAPKGKFPPSQAATVMERAIVECLWEQGRTAPQVQIVCDSAPEAEIYRMTYNLWYAAEKVDRL